VSGMRKDRSDVGSARPKSGSATARIFAAPSAQLELFALAEPTAGSARDTEKDASERSIQRRPVTVVRRS
jgi:hypothetical protein